MAFWKGRQVLVTGGTGFIGSHLVERLLAEGARVRTTGRRDGASWHPLPEVRSQAEYRRGDLRDLSFCEAAAEKQEIVLHLAAVVGGIGFNAPHPALLFYENTLPGLQVLRAAQSAGAGRIVLASSACVYPREARVPTPEEDGFRNDPEAGNVGYGWGKRALEVYARMLALEHGTNIAILRPYNSYGPRDDFSLRTSHVIPALLRKALAPGDEMLVWGDGTPTRSFVYVEDIVEGLLVGAERAPAADPINLGTEEEVSVTQLTKAVLAACGAEKSLRYDTSKPGGQPRRTCDTAKARKLLGWSARVPLAAGLARTVEWIRAHPEALAEAPALAAR